MCFVAAFIKEYSLFSADMTCLGKKVETRVRPALQTGGENTRSTHCLFFMNWMQLRKVFTYVRKKYLQVIRAKNPKVIHIIHKVIRFWG